MGATRKMAKFCSSLSYEDLSRDVVDRVRYLALDFLGVAVRGTLTKSAEIVRNFAKDMGCEGGVIIGTSIRAPYQYAALANGTSSHSLELDDVSNESSAHVGGGNLPSRLCHG